MKKDDIMRFIGSKGLLLEEIEALLDSKVDGTENTFVDLFGGANVVGRYFKKNYEIISNDILYFSYCNALATIENNNKLKFKKLNIDPFEYLMNQTNVDNYSGDLYYTNAYTPLHDNKTMYFSVENGKRIDFIRHTIEEWASSKKINKYEEAYLISSLMEAISLISNTTGTYGAYLKHWDNRALKPLNLVPLPILNNSKSNRSYNKNANDLIHNIEADIVYIDTPYNNRQYASNYHVLENIALHKKPELKGVTKIFDWSNKRSKYSMKRKALAAMEDLISSVNAKHIIISYNDEGIIDFEDMKDTLMENAYDGNVDIVTIPYKKYQSKIPSNKEKLNEYLFYINKKPISNKQVEPTQLLLSEWIPEDTSLIKSPLNYIGGKYRLLDQILPLFPDNINLFLDLFSGGGNVGINVNAKTHVFNDMNYKINEMFRYFSSYNSEILIDKIERRISEYSLSKTNRQGYLDFREQYNINPNPLDLYILISYSYNYQIRFNNSLEFNNPFGKNRSHFSVNMKKNLRRFNNKLRTLKFEFTDFYFEEFDYSILAEKDFVYLDPPYLITTGNYNDGNRGFKNWTEKEEKAMYKLMDFLWSNNIRFALSNVLEHKGNTNELLYNYIKERKPVVHDLNFHYNNSSYNSKKTGSREVLITNYDPITKEMYSHKK